MLGPFDRRAEAFCRASVEEAARARWRQYREIWAYVETGRLPARGDSAPLRRPFAARRRGAGCCDACDPALRLEAPPPDPVEIEDLDDAIVSVAWPPGRPSAAPSAPRSSMARATKKIAAQLLRRASRLRHVLAHAPRRHPLARRRADRGRPPRDTGGAYPVLARSHLRRELPDRRPHLGRGNEPPGAARHGPRAAGRGRRRRVEPSRRGRARARRTPRAWRRRSSRSPTIPDRAARDRALGDWLDERSVELVVLAGFMELLGAELIRRFAGRMINVHPALLPAFPGVRAIEQALDHGVEGHRRDGALRRRGGGQRPDHLAGVLRASVFSRTSRRSRSECMPWSTGCCRVRCA